MADQDRELAVAEGLGDGQLAVLVSHGAALRIGMERFLGIFVEDTPILGGLANCSWSVIELRNGRRRLQEYNAGSLPDPVVIGDDQ